MDNPVLTPYVTPPEILKIAACELLLTSAPDTTAWIQQHHIKSVLCPFVKICIFMYFQRVPLAGKQLTAEVKI